MADIDNGLPFLSRYLKGLSVRSIKYAVGLLSFGTSQTVGTSVILIMCFTQSWQVTSTQPSLCCFWAFEGRGFDGHAHFLGGLDDVGISREASVAAIDWEVLRSSPGMVIRVGELLGTYSDEEDDCRGRLSGVVGSEGATR